MLYPAFSTNGSNEKFTIISQSHESGGGRGASGMMFDVNALGSELVQVHHMILSANLWLYRYVMWLLVNPILIRWLWKYHIARSSMSWYRSILSYIITCLNHTIYTTIAVHLVWMYHLLFICPSCLYIGSIMLSYRCHVLWDSRSFIYQVCSFHRCTRICVPNQLCLVSLSRLQRLRRVPCKMPRLRSLFKPLHMPQWPRLSL